jgi:drug/metabolite transporter (DMT)-like permease
LPDQFFSRRCIFHLDAPLQILHLSMICLRNRFVRIPAISLSVFFAVLAAAALHAGWNAILKIKLEPFLAMVLINFCASIITLPLIFYTGLPRAESWPWLIASVLIHVGYYFALTEAYRRADMSQVYPIARGSAPLLTAVTGIFFLGENVSMQGFAGIALLGLGIFVMSMKNAHDATHMDRKALGFAGLTAITICAYTLSDGTGARVSGDALAYIAALFVADGLFFTAIAWFMRGTAGLRPIAGFWGPGMAGGAMSAGAYGIAIWAMTVAPIPLVAAVRETSVLFGAAIAVLILKEPLRANRVVAAVLIVAGLVLIRLQ